MTASEPYCAYSTQRIFMKCQSVHIIPHYSSKGFTPFRAECEGLSWSSPSFTVCDGVPSPLCYSLLNTHPSQRCSDTAKTAVLILWCFSHQLTSRCQKHCPCVPVARVCTAALWSWSTCVYRCLVALIHACVPFL